MKQWTGLWERTSKGGKRYWTARQGNLLLYLFENPRHGGNEKSPRFNLCLDILDPRKKDDNQEPPRAEGKAQDDLPF